MNKQELIKHFEEMEYVSVSQMGKKAFIDLIKQLDEPQKPVVPQFVADWYEEHKDNLEYNIWDWMKYNLKPKKRENVIFSQWLGKTVNKPAETLVKMKLYGYTVEKEKRYLVKIKGAEEGYNYLNNRISLDSWFFSGESEPLDFRVKHTRKELEEAGFGEVFNSPLFEVEEVAE